MIFLWVFTTLLNSQRLDIVVNQPDQCLSLIDWTHHILKHEIWDIMSKFVLNFGVKYAFLWHFYENSWKKSKCWCLLVKIPIGTYLKLFMFVFEKNWGLLWSLRAHGPNTGVNKSFFTLFERLSVIKILNCTKCEG